MSRYGLIARNLVRVDEEKQPSVPGGVSASASFLSSSSAIGENEKGLSREQTMLMRKLLPNPNPEAPHSYAFSGCEFIPLDEESRNALQHKLTNPEFLPQQRAVFEARLETRLRLLQDPPGDHERSPECLRELLLRFCGVQKASAGSGYQRLKSSPNSQKLTQHQEDTLNMCAEKDVFFSKVLPISDRSAAMALIERMPPGSWVMRPSSIPSSADGSIQVVAVTFKSYRNGSVSHSMLVSVAGLGYVLCAPTDNSAESYEVFRRLGMPSADELRYVNIDCIYANITDALKMMSDTLGFRLDMLVGA